MKASERLRLEASLGNNVYQPWPMLALREAADLLDECERVMIGVAYYSPEAAAMMENTLAKLKAQERG